MSHFIYCCSENTEEHREEIRMGEYLWIADQFPDPHCQIIFLQLGKKLALILSYWFKKTPSFQSYLPFCFSFQERILPWSLEIFVQEECCDFWVPFWSANLSVLFFLVLQLKHSHRQVRFITFLNKVFHDLELPGYPILPLIFPMVAAQHICISLLSLPRCIKFRYSSTNYKLILIFPFSTSWKPPLMHYPGVSRKSLCCPLFQELSWLSCQRRWCCCHQRISVLPPISWPCCFSQDFSFSHPKLLSTI